MALDDLTSDELEIVRLSLQAAVQGPYFPDWEFEWLFGVPRDSVAAVLSAWPRVDEHSQVAEVAINNAFVNLLWYPHGMTEELEDELGVTTSRLQQVFGKWRKP